MTDFGMPTLIEIPDLEQSAALCRRLGLRFMEINMSFPQGVIIPRHGVYAAKAYIDGQEYMSVTNVGIRPTVSDSGNVNVESFLLDFRGNLYGHRARIDFYKFLRPERKFDDVAELAAQIKNDAQTTREYFENKE